MEPIEKATGMATAYRALLLAVHLAACSAETATPISSKKYSEVPTVVDDISPSTKLTSTPAALTNQATAEFSFSGKDDVAIDRFECRLDAGNWQTCSSPQDYAGLAAGAHSIDVRSVDTATNIDASPASWAWFVDRTPPATDLASGPLSATSATSATFMFSGTDNVGVSGFECDRDGLGWGVCNSPVTDSNLTTGAHSFHIRARDTIGNVDASPLEVAWSIYLPYPADPAACFSGGELPQLDLFTGPAT